MADRYIRTAAAKKSRVVVADFSGGADFYSDESVSSPARAKDCYNFEFSDGALKTGYGLSEYSRFGEIALAAVFLYKRYDPDSEGRDDRLVAVSESGELFSCRVDGTDQPASLDIIFTSAPSFINYRLYGDDVLLITSKSDGMYVWDGVNAPYRVENAPNITSMALHYERLFVTVDGEKNAVWFSDDLDPTNWDASLAGGGFIQLIDERGALNRVLSYGGYVYVFRDYGISRITAFGAQTEFSVSNLFVSSGRIYPGSVALCGDTVLFLAEDGLYAFDGVSTVKMLKNLDGLFKNGERSCAYYADGKYYLAFVREETDGKIGCETGSYVNNAMLVLDLSSGSYSLSRGLDICNFCRPDDGGVIAITGSGRAGRVEKCGALFGVPLKKKWRVPKTDLGELRKKRVREIWLNTVYPISVTLRSDTETKTVDFTGGADVQCKRVAFAGRRIGFDIETSHSFVELSRPSLVVTKSGG